MKLSDFLLALGVAVLAMVITMIASYPMVAFYSYVIEPGQTQEFYENAALSIAPWSSYILGPVVFFGCNYAMAKRNPGRNAMLFAVMTIVFYFLVDFVVLLPLMGVSIGSALTMTAAVSVLTKLVGAVLGAQLGLRKGI